MDNEDRTPLFFYHPPTIITRKSLQTLITRLKTFRVLETRRGTRLGGATTVAILVFKKILSGPATSVNPFRGLRQSRYVRPIPGVNRQPKLECYSDISATRAFVVGWRLTAEKKKRESHWVGIRKLIKHSVVLSGINKVARVYTNTLIKWSKKKIWKTVLNLQELKQTKNNNVINK